MSLPRSCLFSGQYSNGIIHPINPTSTHTRTDRHPHPAFPGRQASFSWQRQSTQFLKRRLLIREMPSRESLLLRPEIYSSEKPLAAAAAANML